MNAQDYYNKYCKSSKKGTKTSTSKNEKYKAHEWSKHLTGGMNTIK